VYHEPQVCLHELALGVVRAPAGRSEPVERRVDLVAAHLVVALETADLLLDRLEPLARLLDPPGVAPEPGLRMLAPPAAPRREHRELHELSRQYPELRDGAARTQLEPAQLAPELLETPDHLLEARLGEARLPQQLQHLPVEAVHLAA
jgi:hypothetical protein